MKWLDEVSLKGKRVLVRADFNVPLNEKREITDEFRIQETLPTMQYVLEQGGKLILMSHLGDPEGKVVERLKLDKVQEKLLELLDVSVPKAKDCVGKDIEEWTRQMQEGEILLLENLRFHREEQENDENFAKELASLGDIYVFDAFGVVHREHASVVSLPRLLPSVGGFLLKKEIAGLQKLLENPERPMVAIVGGRKVNSKAKTLERIAQVADEVLLGNLLANEIIAKESPLQQKEKVVFPLDSNPPDREYDIGPKTIKLFSEKVRQARTVFWAGPLGRYEEKEYAQGSRAVAEAIVEDTSYAVAGGGNLLDFLGRYHLREKFDHISTGGSSMLAFLAGEELPGLRALGYYDNLGK